MATGGPARPAEEPEEEEEEEEEVVNGEQEEGDYSFIKPVYDIIKSMDKDQQEVYQKLTDLKNKFQTMRKLINNMPGIDLTPEQQQEHLQRLKEQVQTKSELLHKYKGLCMFEIPKD
ncbi:mediator of RNA polymerase II transcription subunit 9 [Rhinophrynus dorsalis]